MQDRSMSATELDLLTFFEAEPKLRDPGNPWSYNDAAYHGKRSTNHALEQPAVT
jgi:hypothetical protein